MAETIGQRIQRLRQAAGLSQAALAKESRVPIGTLRNWEQDRRIPALDAAASLARVLRVSLDEMVVDTVPAKTGKAAARPTGKGRPAGRLRASEDANKAKGKKGR